MKKRGRKILIGSVLVVLLGAGFTTLNNQDMELVKNLDIYYTLFRELNMFYVDETDPEKLVTTSINSMLSSLDPYTSYIPESEMDNFNYETTGEYGGIGSIIRASGKYALIADPYQGFPADKAGLRAGDVIRSINGKDVEGMALDKVSEQLKGKPGTEIKLKVKRFGEDELLDFALIREKIEVKNVPYFGMLDKHTGYIRLSRFTTGASGEVESALKSLKKENELKSLVLDLRSNPGGLLNEAVLICNLFVDKGEAIVSTKGKVKHWDSEYVTRKNPVDKDLPLVVMVNRGSASASEIVAGALQDLDRAIVVGQRTFGKGLVQTTRPLKYNAQLKVTTAKYYIPSGRCIQALDYSHRNDDGSVGTIPDSLISEYETRNGRPVFDGGGIQPDIEVDSEQFSEISIQLFAQNMFFDYATEFRARNDSISIASIYSISDGEYESFKSFVEQKDFEFKTATEKAFDQLLDVAKKEKYYDVAQAELDSLEIKLSHNNLKDLETFNDEIRQLLAEEITNRYYYQTGRIEQQLKNDIQLDSAVHMINEPGKVKNILAGGEGALAKGRTESN